MTFYDDKAATINALVAAVEAIEIELGIVPAGVYADVRTRLDILEARINNPFAPSPDVLNPFFIGNTGVTIQAGFGDPNVSLALPPPKAGSLFLREDGYVNQGLYSFRGDGYWHQTDEAFHAGGDLDGDENSQTVIGIQGNPVQPGILGSGQNGYVLTWNNTANQWQPQVAASGFSAGGDLSGTSTSQNVIAVHGATVPIAGALTTGNILKVSGASALSYGALNLALAASVTGVLPAVNQASQTVGGDISGTTAAATVIGIRGNSVPTPSGSNTVLTWSGTTLSWSAAGSSFTAGGDLAGTSTSQNVVAIHGSTVPIGGALTTGNVLQVSGASALSYGALNLASSNSVTGVLPAANQASQTLTGDVVGTTAANTLTLAGDVTGRAGVTVVSGIRGNSVPSPSGTNTFLQWSGSSFSWAVASGSFTAGGDLTGTSSTQTVISIHGATVPIAGSLTTGNGLYVTGTSALSYSALNLAGGANFVTGVLPAANQASQTLTGDVVGTTGANTLTLAGDVTGRSGVTVVGKLQGAITLSGTPSIGQVLTATSATTANWQASAGGPPSGSAGGDLGSTYPNPTVTGIRGNSVPSPSGTNTFLQWSGSTFSWAVASGTFTAGGDLSGTSTSQNVIAIHGATVPIAGSLTTGNGLYVTGTSALSYSALNLAGGANFVTGVLPSANQAAQTLTGDVVGTTAANTLTLAGDVTGRSGVTVVGKVNGSTVPAGGSLTTGNVLQVSGSSALTYGAVNLASSASVTGVLPAANQAAQTMGGDVSGTTTSSSVVAIRGKALNVSLALIGAIQDGYALTWVNASSDWEARPVSSTSFTAAGDLSGTSSSQTVIGLQTHPVLSQSLGAAQDGYVLTWSNSGNNWLALAAPSGTFTAAGDLSGTSTSQTVTGIRGNPVSASAATAGQFLIENTAATGSAWTSLSGDVANSATTSGQITVTKINGTSVTATPTSGQVLTATSGTVSAWALIANANVSATAAIVYSKLSLTNSIVNNDIATSAGIVYSKLNLATSIVNNDISTTASIAVSKLAAGSAGQILVNNATPTPTWTTVSGDAIISSAGAIKNIALQNNAVLSQSLGSTQDGYVLTWHNVASSWQALPVSTSGGAGTTVQTGYNYGSFLNIYPFPGQTNTASTTFVTGCTFEFNPATLTAANGTRTIKLRVVAETTGPQMTIQLFNITAASVVTGSTLTTTATTATSLTTGDLTANLSVGLAIYQVQIEMAAGGTSNDRVTLDMATLQIVWS